tara:strand:- start:345 stop:1244 length:900 start_codon:yes stop_codon:yes gene_type:complete
MTRARDIANLLGTNTNGIIDNAKITLDAAEVPNLAASKITSETFVDARLPNLATSKITSGTFADARIPNLNASKINAGTLADARIPNLNASKINAGTVATARLGSGTASSSTFLRGDGTFAEAGGGEWSKLSHITANNDATVVFNSSLITSTYQDYKVVYSNIHSASDRQNFELRVSVDNGSNITNTDYVNRLYKPDGHVSSRGVTNSAEFLLHGNETSGNGAGESLSGFIEIFDPSATDTRKHILGRTVFNLGDSGIVHSHSLLGASTRVTNAVNYLRFNWASGNIASGEFTLYGRKI